MRATAATSETGMNPIRVRGRVASLLGLFFVDLQQLANMRNQMHDARNYALDEKNDRRGALGWA